MKELDTRGSNLPSRRIEALIIDSAETFEASVTTNTKRAYEADWNHYVAFCRQENVNPTPPDATILIAYFQALSKEKKLKTILRRRFGIKKALEEQGFEDPFSNKLMKDFFRGIRRLKADEGVDQPHPVTRDVLSMLMGAIELYPDGIAKVRDKAIITLGFAAGGRRRSELAALEVRDLTFDKRGLKVKIRKSKTDQEGKGATVGVLYSENEALCPVRSVNSWLEAAGINNGRVFRRLYRGGSIGKSITGGGISTIIKGLAQMAGLPYRHYSGHSLRHGFAVQASEDGYNLQQIMSGTLHADPASVLNYMKQAQSFSGAQVL